MSLELCLSIIGAITGTIGAVVGLSGIFHNRFLAVNEFMEKLEDAEFIEAKSYIYNRGPTEPFSIQDKTVAIIVNFVHHWGLLAKKHFLPLWVFDSGTGAGAIRLYELTSEYILARRHANNDSTYGSNFEWLYHTLKKRRIKKNW